MSTRAAPRKARKSLTASRQRRVIAQHSAGAAYRRGRAAIVLAMFILFFGFLWMANGNFTALFVINRGGSAAWGWAIHLLLTAIEIGPTLLRPYFVNIPRRVLIFLWVLSLPFGIFDVISSAIGVAPWFMWTSAAGVTEHVQNTLLGELIAFLPEPMILWLLVAFRNVVRS